MHPEYVHIGLGNVLFINRVIAIVPPDSAPVKRSIKNAKVNDKLIDMTSGRRTRAVIFTESDHIILAALAPETIIGRIQAIRGGVVIKPEVVEKENK
jgi:regulator of extracellular matrix RemA (YlzA/DUF370 family)